MMGTNWIKNNTLSAEKPFLWFYDGERIIIKRKFKNNPEFINIFSNDEIEKLILYIKQNSRVALANSVTKVQDGTEKDGIGKFIYNNINKDSSKQQAASQLVTIFYNADILLYNNKKKNMEFWINNINWKERILSYIDQYDLVNK